MATDKRTDRPAASGPESGSHGDAGAGGWADNPRIRQRILRVLYVVCAILVAADFVVHRHISTPVEKMPAFYALYGFVALVGVVVAAKGLRRLVKRDEGYYDR